MYNFKNKKGVILGSTGLLGSRLAKKLSELGADLILHGKTMPVSTEKWTRKPYTRLELNNLAKLSLNMSQVEIRKRLKALEFPGAQGAYLPVSDLKLSLSDTNKLSLNKG